MGKFTFSSGNVYNGEWVNGRREGKGTLLDKNGKIISEGSWFQGKFMD